MPLETGYLKSEEIAAQAEAFLAQYHPSGEIPVPIVEIVEFDLGIELFPLPDAQKLYGFMAALSSDLQTIVYDEQSDKKNLHRFRLTLAHEVGHFVLHGTLIAALALQTKQDWKQAVTEIDPQMYTRLEIQAFLFAGQVLVPTPALRSAVAEIVQRAEANKFNLSEAGEEAYDLVARPLANQFKVSTEVISRRIKAEGYRF